VLVGRISWRNVFEKRKNTNQILPYYLCIIRNWFIMVWMVWIVAFCFEWISCVQALGTTTVATAAGMAWVFLDKILGHKLSAMGLVLGTVVGLVAITPAAGFSKYACNIHWYFLVVL
jgi:ammonia channel protein AmtB